MNDEINDLIRDSIDNERWRAISFRVTEKEYERIEATARKRGEKPNSWSRHFVLSEALKDFGMTWVERLIFEEIARIRFLLGSAYSLMAQNRFTNEEWMRLLSKADQEPSALADSILSLRQKKSLLEEDS